MHLFFDTETTGLPKNYRAPVTDLANWPRMIQVAWLLADAAGAEVKSAEHIIKPVGFSIPPEAAKIHGITQDHATRVGVDLGPVLEAIAADVSQAAVLVAHNIQFDEKILGAELLRAGRPNALELKPRRCTMQSSTNYCQLPGPYGYKWPKLQELHGRLFKSSFEGAHNALSDVRATARCYFELRRLGVM
ncbi:MAG: 3'-5' exonuclease [Elusimicrobia bacterium]|nr:3'-5' exonuclease [Elusimicrobiota bacterium]